MELKFVKFLAVLKFIIVNSNKMKLLMTKQVVED